MSRACPLCETRSPRALKAMSYALPEGSSLPARTEISQCLGCGFLYADSEAAPEAYRAHYESGSIYAASDIRPGDGSNANDALRLRQAAERIASAMPPRSLLIDIGAATGGLLEAARGLMDCQALGLDPDPACVRALRERGHQAEVATLSSLPQTLIGSAGAVALSHVLEHLWEPAKELKAALALLRDDGVAYVEIPDAARYHEYPNALNYYFDPEHINHFTIADFDTLARRAGARVLQSGQSEILLEDGSGYPVAWALLATGAASEPSRREPSSHPALAYIRQQEARERQAEQAFQSALNGVESVLIWGTGSHAQRSLASGAIPASKIAAFIDSDPSKQGKTLLGRPILSPERAMGLHPKAPALILAASAAERSIRAALALRWPERALIESASLDQKH